MPRELPRAKRLPARSAALLLAALAAAAVAGCGGGDRDEADERQPQPTPSRSQAAGAGALPEPPATIGAGEAAAALILEPQVAAPGARVGLAVDNRGELPLLYGLGATLERSTTGGWEPVRTPERFTAAVSLSAAPGETAGPGYDGFTDVLALPRGLKAGLYRVTKPAATPGERTQDLELQTQLQLRAG